MRLKYTRKKTSIGTRHILRVGRLRFTFSFGRWYTGARLQGIGRKWTAGTIATPLLLVTWMVTG